MPITLADTAPGSTSDADANLNNNWTAIRNKFAAGILTADLADDSVTAAKIAAGAVGSSELAALAITDAKVAAAAAIAVSKLAGGSVGALLYTGAGPTPAWTAAPTDGKELRAVGTTPTWVAPHIYDRQGTLNDVVNTVAETVLYAKVIAANDLGTKNSLRLTLTGDYLNNSGTDKTLTIRVKFGGVTFYAETTVAIPSSANRRVFRAELVLGNLGGTAAQHLSGLVDISNSALPTTGLGQLAGGQTVRGVISSAAADPSVDTTVNQTLEVTVQHSAAVATVSVRMKYAVLELLAST